MPITVEWNDKSKSLIECRIQDPWSIEQLIEARKSWHRMIKTIDDLVPILLDMRETHDVPAGALRHLTAIQRTPHPRQGHLYVLGLNPNYEKLSSFVFCGEGKGERKVRLVDSIDRILDPDLPAGTD